DAGLSADPSADRIGVEANPGSVLCLVGDAFCFCVLCCQAGPVPGSESTAFVGFTYRGAAAAVCRACRVRHARSGDRVRVGVCLLLSDKVAGIQPNAMG